MTDKLALLRQKTRELLAVPAGNRAAALENQGVRRNVAAAVAGCKAVASLTGASEQRTPKVPHNA